jgi:hypothetical protein
MAAPLSGMPCVSKHANSFSVSFLIPVLGVSLKPRRGRRRDPVSLSTKKIFRAGVPDFVFRFV